MIQDTGTRPAINTPDPIAHSGPVARVRTAASIPAPLTEEGLGRTVGLALRALTDRTVPRAATCGQLEELLRSAIGWSRLRLPGQDTPTVGQAAVAVRVACAYLAAGDLPEAELALIVAEDLLGSQRPVALPDALAAPSMAGRRSPAA